MKTLNSILESIRKSANPQSEIIKHAYNGLPKDKDTEIASRGFKPYHGKVRDLIIRDQDILMIHSDRLTAFDRFIAMVPYKGTILTELSEFWLKKAGEIMPTHFIARPHERILQVEKTTPVKVEVVVRGYLAGSMMRAYEQGERLFCGVKLPEGLKPYGKLPMPIITPTTKAAAFEHDENSSAEDLIKKGICTQQEWQTISEMAFSLFKMGNDIYAKIGWILVDTKYEFGRSKDGTIKLIDELHTPDSSRLWKTDTYNSRLNKGEAPEMFDKEIVRRYLLGQGFSGYGDVPEVPPSLLLDLVSTYLFVTEKLTGKTVMSEGIVGDLKIP